MSQARKVETFFTSVARTPESEGTKLSVLPPPEPQPKLLRDQHIVFLAADTAQERFLQRMKYSASDHFFSTAQRLLDASAEPCTSPTMPSAF